MPRRPGRRTITQENTANTNAHEHKVVEYWPARWIPRSAGTRRYAPAEPSGSWTRRGNPAGIWSEMRPAPYANPIGHID